MITTTPNNANVAASGVPFYTPAQVPPAGAAFDESDRLTDLPKLFQPLRIRSVEFPNRIWVSPMCQYSACDGFFTPWHHAHLGGIFTRGPGLTMVESTAVLREGRITPEDSGIWSDDHIEHLKNIVTFAHSQSQKIGLQLAHAGRKASTAAPWITGDETASEAVGGWPDDVWAPSAIPFSKTYPQPKELTKEGIKAVVRAFGEGAKRALKAGFDLIEIHGAHGYLINSFLSPVSNKRTDEYGGSFDNRTRLLLEIVDTVRGIIPDTMPLFVRVSATDWLEEVLPNEPSWTSEDTTRLAPILYAHGVDLLDVSSGGNHDAQKIRTGGPYQSPFARDVMQAIGAKKSFPPNIGEALDGNGRLSRLLVSSVGGITTGPMAEKLLQEAYADVVFAGRAFLRNPGLVWAWADELTEEGKPVYPRLAHQIGWGFKGRGKKTSDGKENQAKAPEDLEKVGKTEV